MKHFSLSFVWWRLVDG